MNSIYEFLEETNERDKSGHKLCKFRCKNCGQIMLLRYIYAKDTKICRHMYKKSKNPRLSHIHYQMINRCYNKNNKDYTHYGQKGVIVCDEWLYSFENFYNWSINNGYADNLTIDRIDYNGNYEPTNCRWVTREFNSGFKSTTHMITINGISKSGIQWSKALGRSKNYINKMLKDKGITYTKDYIKKHIALRES